jgi:hypothetical protein
MASPLFDLLPSAEADSDELLGRFLDYVAGLGLELYPAQEEAILELPEPVPQLLRARVAPEPKRELEADGFEGARRPHRGRTGEFFEGEAHLRAR